MEEEDYWVEEEEGNWRMVEEEEGLGEEGY